MALACRTAALMYRMAVAPWYKLSCKTRQGSLCQSPAVPGWGWDRALAGSACTAGLSWTRQKQERVTSHAGPAAALLLPTSARVPSPPYQHFPVLAVPVEAEEVAQEEQQGDEAGGEGHVHHPSLQQRQGDRGSGHEDPHPGPADLPGTSRRL